MPECDVRDCSEPGVERIFHPRAPLETRWLCSRHLRGWQEANPDPQPRTLAERDTPTGRSNPSTTEPSLRLTTAQKRILLTMPTHTPDGWTLDADHPTRTALQRKGYLDDNDCLTEAAWAFRAEHWAIDPREAIPTSEAAPEEEQEAQGDALPTCDDTGLIDCEGFDDAVSEPMAWQELTDNLTRTLEAALEGKQHDIMPLWKSIHPLVDRVRRLENRANNLRELMKAAKRSKDNAEAAGAESVYRQLRAILDPEGAANYTRSELLEQVKLLKATSNSAPTLTLEVDSGWVWVRVGHPERGVRMALGCWDEVGPNGGEVILFDWSDPTPDRIPVLSPEHGRDVVLALLATRGIYVPQELLDAAEQDEAPLGAASSKGVTP